MKRLLIAAALCAFSLPTQAQQVEFRCPKPGTVVETSVSGRLEFGQGEGFLCQYRSKDGTERRRFAALLADSGLSYEQHPDKVKSLWPLEVGKRVSFDNYKGQTSWNIVYSVTGKEEVTVPAGRFSAYIIEYQENSNNASYSGGMSGVAYKAKSRYWYAPEIAYFVKFRHEHIEGTPANMKDWDATAVSIPQ